MSGLSLKKQLWSPWEKARGALMEDLKTIETVLNQFMASIASGGTLNPFAILGDPKPATRYVANTGPGNVPKWDQVDLSNGVKSFLDLSHLGPASLPQVVVGYGDAPLGAFQEILLDPTELKITAGMLSLIPGAGGGGVPYFIPSGSTFTVPLYVQALFSMTIDNEGIIDVDGFLIEVD
jgi:hypothetical protein